jgi:hypothetical protein
VLRNLVLGSLLLAGGLALAGCGNSDPSYGKPGDSTLPDAVPFESGQAAPQAMPDRKPQ